MHLYSHSNRGWKNYNSIAVFIITESGDRLLNTHPQPSLDEETHYINPRIVEVCQSTPEFLIPQQLKTGPEDLKKPPLGLMDFLQQTSLPCPALLSEIPKNE